MIPVFIEWFLIDFLVFTFSRYQIIMPYFIIRTRGAGYNMMTHFTVALLVLVLFSLVSVYLFLRAVLYRIVVQMFWGERAFYDKRDNHKLMSLIVSAGLCPSPELPETEKDTWTKFWWLQGFIAIVLFSGITLLSGFFSPGDYLF